MPVVKSFAVGNGDMFYIKHSSDNFTMIDCDLCEENAETFIDEMKRESKGKGITRFISTHPDEDHFGGIERLDDAGVGRQLRKRERVLSDHDLPAHAERQEQLEDREVEADRRGEEHARSHALEPTTLCTPLRRDDRNVSVESSIAD